MGEHLILVGIFKEEIRAENAVAVLKDVGFSNDQISYASQTGKQGLGHILQNLLSMGVPEEEMNYYKSEFEAGRSIVLVKHDGRRSQSLAILLLEGARNHKYLKMDENAGKEPFNRSAYTKKSPAQLEATQNFGANSTSKTSDSQESEPFIDDERASLQKLLEREGLDHLL